LLLQPPGLAEAVSPRGDLDRASVSHLAFWNVSTYLCGYLILANCSSKPQRRRVSSCCPDQARPCASLYPVV
jgi:hypothetical protein